MHVDVIQKDHYWILVCSGNTVGDSPRPLPQASDAIKSGATDIILDFSKLTYLSSMGIKSLAETLELAKNHGVHIGIASPGPEVRKTLKINGLTREMPLYHNLDEAISKLDLLDYNAESWQENSDMLLIIHNELMIAGDLRNALKDHPFNPGFRMKPVRTSEEAMDVLLSERVDCILIDSTFKLFQVAKFIENIVEDTVIPTIPVIIVTRDDRVNEAEAMVRHGADEILRIPINPVEVVIRISNAISHFKDHRPYFPPKSIPQPRGWRA